MNLEIAAKGNENRKKILDKYRSLGDFNHTIEVLLQKSGNFIVCKRPKDDKLYSADQYLPCQYCLTFYVATYLWRHIKKCSLRTNPHDPSKIKNFPNKECMKAGKMLLQGAVNLGEDNASEVHSCCNNTEFIRPGFEFYDVLVLFVVYIRGDPRICL